jgi:hypothetical protein
MLDSTEDLQESVKFYKRDKLINFPYTPYWLRRLDREALFITILARNIKIYQTYSKKTIST